MAFPFFVRREGSVLVPASKAGQLALEKLRHGVLCKIEPSQPRNGKQHRLFWAFVTYLAEALNDGPTGAIWTAENVKDDLLVATGRTRNRPMTRLERARHNVPPDIVAIVARPVSISFVAMGGDEFSAFMDDAMAYVRDHLAPWIEASDHWAEIEKILVASFLMQGDEGGESHAAPPLRREIDHPDRRTT
jgi:hypothetical protein